MELWTTLFIKAAYTALKSGNEQVEKNSEPLCFINFGYVYE